MMIQWISRPNFTPPPFRVAEKIAETAPVTHLSRQFQGLSATEDAVICAVLRFPETHRTSLDDMGLLKSRMSYPLVN